MLRWLIISCLWWIKNESTWQLFGLNNTNLPFFPPYFLNICQIMNELRSSTKLYEDDSEAVKVCVTVSSMSSVCHVDTSPSIMLLPPPLTRLWSMLGTCLWVSWLFLCDSLKVPVHLWHPLIHILLCHFFLSVVALDKGGGQLFRLKGHVGV